MLQQRQAALETDNAENPILGGTGKVIENVLEFLSPDDALKGLSLSEKYLQSAKLAKFLETASPRMLKVIDLGTAALRNAIAQGGVTTLKTGGDVGQGAEQGLLAGGLTAGLGAAGMTVSAIRNALDATAIQKPLQDGMRSILADVATKMGVDAPTAASIRDVASQVSDSIKAKASGMYDLLDSISGGRAQRFREAAKAIGDEQSNLVDLDDEREAALEVKRQQVDAAHKAFLDELEAGGHDRISWPKPMGSGSSRAHCPT